MTYPAAGNLGGGGFMTIQFADGRKTFIDFRETAPLAATPRHVSRPQRRCDSDLSMRGHLAVAVPGTVSGLEYVREKYGSCRAAALIAPAISLAERGFVLEQGDVDMLREGIEDFRKDARRRRSFSRLTAPRRCPGETLVQQDLAHTLRAISERGVDGFYKGRVAAALVASSRAGNGIIAQADLDKYQTREHAPIECDYRSLRVDLGAAVEFRRRHALPDAAHSRGLPAARTRFRLRAGAALRDRSDATRVTSIATSTRRSGVREESDRQAAGSALRGTHPRLDRSEARRASSKISPGVASHEGAHTTHYSIADNSGNAVAVTYTLNDWFGARVTAGGTGVLLNNEMDDFTAKVGRAEHVRSGARRRQQDRTGQDGR